MILQLCTLFSNAYQYLFSYRFLLFYLSLFVPCLFISENLFQELDQFGSFSDKDSKAISVHQKLEPVLFSRRRRSFPDDPGEQQTGDFSDKTHLNEIQNNPKHVFPDSVSNIVSNI